MSQHGDMLGFGKRIIQFIGLDLLYMFTVMGQLSQNGTIERKLLLWQRHFLIV